MILILFAILLLISSQQQQNNQFDRQALEEYLNSEEYRIKSAEQDAETILNTTKNDQQSAVGYNEDYSVEAAQAGWGTSRWDKGTYHPGMNLDEARKKERDAYYSRLVTIVGALCGIAAGIYVVMFLIREERDKKKKKNPWRDSSFTSDY